jgi:hypothetical protein
MTADIEQLRRDVTGAQQRHAAAVSGVAGAEGRAAAAREDLKAAFGIETVAEAEALLEGLRRQIEERAAQVRAHLEAAR